MALEAHEQDLVPTGVFGGQPERAEESGRFVIEPRTSGIMLPPSSAVAEEVLALQQLEPLDQVVVQAPRSLPPPVPPVAASRPPARLATDEAASSALQPQYSGLRVSDRVELHIDDLSLALDNPYARSSLLPPPPRPASAGRWALGVVALGGAVAVGAAGMMLYVTQSAPKAHPPIAAHGMARAVVPPPAAVRPQMQVQAPVQPAPSQEVPHVALQVAPVPVAVAPTPAAPAPVAAAQMTVAPVAVAKVPAAQVAAPVAASSAPVVVKHAPVVPAVTEAPSSGEPTTAPSPAVPAESAPTAAVTAPVAPAAPAVIEPAAEVLPEAPSREDIVAGFEKVRPDVAACAEGAHGTAVASVTISGSGRVTYALVDGAFAGTPAGSCIARTVRKATFPKFASPSLKVSYPFVL